MRSLRWVALSFVPAVIGAPFPAPDWYRSLRKPAWAPPPWIFGPVWTVLYLLMGIAASLVAAGPGPAGDRKRALDLFRLQLVLNAAWTPIFFGLRRPGVALVEIGAMLIAIAATTVAFAGRRPLAAGLLVPYLAWTAFATVLNWEIWRRNR